MKVILALIFAATLKAQGNGYTYARTITIDHLQVPSTQTGFPFVFTGSYSFLRTTGNGGNVESASGFDIIFTSDSTCGSLLTFERALWSASTGAAEFWILVASLSSSTDTVLYLCYGKPADSEHANPTAVWDANYKLVWHEPDGSTLTAADSTGNADNGTLSNTAGSNPTATTGKIDGAAAFTFINSNYIANSNVISAPDVTVSMWVNITDFSGVGQWCLSTFANGQGNTTADKVLAIDKSLQKAQWYIFSGGPVSVTASGTISTGVWHYLVGTADGSNLRLYQDGVQVASTAAGSSFNGYSVPNFFASGGLCNTGGGGLGGQYYTGAEDEVRVSNIARAADWIAAEYANQNAPGAFYTISGASGGTVGGGLLLLGVGN